MPRKQCPYCLSPLEKTEICEVKLCDCGQGCIWTNGKQTSMCCKCGKRGAPN